MIRAIDVLLRNNADRVPLGRGRGVALRRVVLSDPLPGAWRREHAIALSPASPKQQAVLTVVRVLEMIAAVGAHERQRQRDSCGDLASFTQNRSQALRTSVVVMNDQTSIFTCSSCPLSRLTTESKITNAVFGS